MRLQVRPHVRRQPICYVRSVIWGEIMAFSWEAAEDRFNKLKELIGNSSRLLK